MNIPISWILENLNIETSDKEYSDKMTMLGQKVERYYKESDGISGIVTGKIKEIRKHPNADTLFVCKADIGEQALTIVTGATNLYEGAVVPVALDGAVLASGSTISTSDVRGVRSDGMFCSLAELNLTIHDFPENREDGIMILPPDTPFGKDISSVLSLDDTVFEFEITSNRPDCMSVIGIKRETAAAYGVPFLPPEPEKPEGTDTVDGYLKVINKTKNCFRYSAAVVKNVKVSPSPQWMRERLRKCGLRPINNIIDITNYVMLEYGQPMHAFDHRHIEDKTIVIRQAVKGESIITLDGEKHPLDESIMVIADAKKPSAVAGVMGGEFSGIYDDTDTVIFESASFDNLSVRFSAKKLGMRTDSSALFEKGLDPHATLPALYRALELITVLGAGDVVNGIIDIHEELPSAKKIPLDANGINALLGTSLSEEYMTKALRSFNFSVDNNLVVTVPTYRMDVEGTADLAEEVARLYGYNNIPSTVMSGIALGHLTEHQRFERALKSICTAAGFFETTTLSFMSNKSLDLICAAANSHIRNAVRISNPFGEETSLMRTTLLPSLMEVLVRNFNVRAKSALVFELSARYFPTEDEKLPDEKKSLTVMGYGVVDFFLLKGLLNEIFESAGLKNPRYEVMADNPSYHPGRSARVYIKNISLAEMGEIHPTVTDNYGIRTRCYALELDVDALFNLRNPVVQYTELPRYPAIVRDLALVCDKSVYSSEIEAVLKKVGGSFLESVNVFDVYTGDGVPDGKKSIAYNLTLRDREKTLTDVKADTLVDSIMTELEYIGIILRK